MGELISVIIPVYNVEPYLDNCLSSVLNQSYREIEIIVIDDGSTDNSLQIANHYQSVSPEKFHVLHTENQGVTLARFEGIKIAKGEWIGFVDGDDEIDPDMYERLYDNAKKYNASISHCGYRTIVNGGERIHDFYNTGRLVQQDKQSGLLDLLVGPIEPTLCTKLYRKELIDCLFHEEIIDTSIKYNEDLLMNYFLFREADKAVYEDFCGYHYLARSSSATRSGFCVEKVLDPVKVWRKILDCSTSDMEVYAWRKYLIVCTNAYARLAYRTGFTKEALVCRKELIDNKDKWSLLHYKEVIKLRLVLFSPLFYNKAYSFYEKHFQKKVYE